MNKELEEFKTKRINALKKQHEIDVKSLQKMYTYTINNTIKNNRFARSSNKNALIQKYMTYYNNILLSLINKLNANIENVNKMAILPIKITRKKALIFGLNYIGTDARLNGCITDAKNIEVLLKANNFNDTKLITDETNIKPTKDNMLKEIKKIISEAIEGDLIFIYYSGHGTQELDKGLDEIDGLDELIAPLDFMNGRKFIKDDELKLIIQENLKANVNLFCLFDCCTSGTALDLRYQFLEKLNYDNFTENLKNLETKGNVVFISGSRDNEYSFENNFGSDNTQGVMTRSFREIINNKGNQISWRVLLKSIRDLVKKYNSPFQTPQLSSGLVIDLDSNVWI